MVTHIEHNTLRVCGVQLKKDPLSAKPNRCTCYTLVMATYKSWVTCLQYKHHDCKKAQMALLLGTLHSAKLSRTIQTWWSLLLLQGFMLCWAEGEPEWSGKKWGRAATFLASMPTCQRKHPLALRTICDDSHQVYPMLSCHSWSHSIDNPFFKNRNCECSLSKTHSFFSCLNVLHALRTIHHWLFTCTLHSR